MERGQEGKQEDRNGERGDIGEEEWGDGRGEIRREDRREWKELRGKQLGERRGVRGEKFREARGRDRMKERGKIGGEEW